MKLLFFYLKKSYFINKKADFAGFLEPIKNMMIDMM